MKNNDKRIIYIYFQQFVSFHFFIRVNNKNAARFIFCSNRYQVSRYRFPEWKNCRDIYKKKKREKNAITIFPTVRFIISHSGRDKSPRKKEKEKKNPSKIVNRIPIFTFSRKLNTYSRGIDLYREMDS